MSTDLRISVDPAHTPTVINVPKTPTSPNTPKPLPNLFKPLSSTFAPKKEGSKPRQLSADWTSPKGSIANLLAEARGLVQEKPRNVGFGRKKITATTSSSG